MEKQNEVGQHLKPRWRGIAFRAHYIKQKLTSHKYPR